MTFALVLAAVVIVSAAVLLRQYWSGELAERGDASPAGEPRRIGPGPASADRAA